MNLLVGSSHLMEAILSLLPLELIRVQVPSRLRVPLFNFIAPVSRPFLLYGLISHIIRSPLLDLSLQEVLHIGRHRHGILTTLSLLCIGETPYYLHELGFGLSFDVGLLR